MSASRRLKELQSQPGNKICVDCSQKIPQWASISYGVFMCLECSGKHRGLGVHISFVRSVTMDSWSEIQLKKMELGGNDRFNNFISQYGITKETDIVTKYNTKAASVYRDKIQALAEAKPWRDPPVVREILLKGGGGCGVGSKPPLSGVGGSRTGSNLGGNSDWDSWDHFDNAGSANNINNNIRRNHSVGDFRSGGSSGGTPARSKSTENIYSRTQLESSAANKESFFAKKMAENETRQEGIPPSQGGKYVGFGSSPAPVPTNSSSQGDVLSSFAQGFGKLSLVAASVVQSGTKELTTKVIDGGYDVNVVTAKTSEIGQKTWGMMKGVMALASQKVEEYTKENGAWDNDGWQSKGSVKNGYHEEFGQDSKGRNSSVREQPSSVSRFNSVSSGSWDDWGDRQDSRKEEPTKGTPNNGDGWGGWDDHKDDGFDTYYQASSDSKAVASNGKPESRWTGGGFL